MYTTNSRINLTAKILLAFIIAIYFFFFIKISISEGLMIHEPDDINYYTITKSFNETNSIAYPFENSQAKIGKASWYGPIISVIYGTLSKLIGFNEGKSFIISNMIFMIFAMGILLYIGIKKNNGYLYLLLMLLLLNPTLQNIPKYQPVALMFLFTTFLTISFNKLIDFHLQNKLNKKHILLFTALILLGSLIRINFLIWLGALLFIANKNDKKRLFLLAGISLITVFLVFLYKIFFCAKFVVWQLKALEEGAISTPAILFYIKWGVKMLIEKLYNSDIFFYQLITIIGLLAIKLIKEKEYKMLTTSAILSALYIFVFLMLYSWFPSHFNKEIIVIAPLFLLPLCFNEKLSNLRDLVIILLLMYFPTTIMKTRDALEERVNSYKDMQQYNTYKQKVNNAITQVITNKQSSIYLTGRLLNNSSENFFNYQWNWNALLPVSNGKGQSIYYTDNKQTADFIFDIDNKDSSKLIKLIIKHSSDIGTIYNK